MNADGSGQTDLSNDLSSQDYAPNWSPDGMRIAYARSVNFEAAEIFVMNT